MSEKEVMNQELNEQLSEREDLITQLNEQDRIMKILTDQLEKSKREKDDYMQVVFQLQRKGRYLDEGIWSYNVPYLNFIK